VGEAIAQSGPDRSDVFVTSKLNNNQLGYDAAMTAFDKTLVDLGLEKIDLFLIHWPLPTKRDFVETWKAFEAIYRDGRARSIGVSNFQPHHLRRLHEETTVPTAVNQIEVHPYLTQEALRAVYVINDDILGGRHRRSAEIVYLFPSCFRCLTSRSKELSKTSAEWFSDSSGLSCLSSG
jgi:diketogulonate reductase-like aldo/keto reductase